MKIEKKKQAPMSFVIIAILMIQFGTILYGIGFAYNILYIKSSALIWNLLSVIVICNLAFRKGIEKNN